MKIQDNLEYVNCNLCGSDDYEVVHENQYENETSEDLSDKFKSSGDETLIDQVVKCKKCGFQYINPRIRQDLIIKGYSDGTDENFASQAKGRERTFARCLDKVEKHLPPSKVEKRGRVLDIGTANGSFLHVAKKRGWEVEGLELNRWLCAWARKNYKIQVQPRNLFDQNYPDNHFDLVTLWDVLEHVPDAKKMLEECHRITKKDGYVVINYPNVGSWLAKLMGRKWIFMLSVHLFYFTPRTIKSMLKKTGFEVVHSSPHFQTLELGYLMFRMRAYSMFLHKFGSRITKLLGMEKSNIMYWLGQTIVIAKKS